MSTILEAAATFVALLAGCGVDGADAELVDELTALERVKSAVGARQARVTDALAQSQRAKLIDAGARGRDASRSVCAQVGLARRDSPRKGNRHVGLAAMLVREMPGVLQVLQRGDTSEWRATIIARETAHLTVEQRAEIDTAIADQLHAWGDVRTEREVRALVQRLDPHGAAERAAKAAVDRRVTIRPAPDCMTYLTALLPVKEGCAVFGELHRRAMAGAVDPDEHRGKGQIMADELVRRVLTPAEGEARVPGLEVHLVMTDRTLLDADDEPAQVVGHGPVPAPLARDLVRADEKTKVWVRRLYTNTAGELVSTDARKRDFPEVARAFLTVRDQICRTPFCGAPIRHADHSLAVSKGGETDVRNGGGRCACCNLFKDTIGWATLVRKDGTIVTTTPTGQQHISPVPRPPRSGPWKPEIVYDIQWPDTG